MSHLKHARCILILTMILVFLYIVGQSLVKYLDRTIGETQSTKKATEMYFPSIYLCPVFKTDFYKSQNKTQYSKNLTEYFENIPSVRDTVLSINQSYEADNK